MQNVGTPRFYCNILEFGALGIDNIFRTLPVNPKIIEGTIDIPNIPAYTNKSFIAVLGHNYGDYSESNFRLGNKDNYEEVINATISNNRPYPTFNGFSIATFLGDNDIEMSFISSDYDAIEIGSVII